MHLMVDLQAVYPATCAVTFMWHHSVPDFISRIHLTNSSGIIKARAKPISAFAQSKAWVCDRMWIRILPGGMDVCILGMLCVNRSRSLWHADHSSRGVLPSVVFPNMILKCRQQGGLYPTRATEPWGKKGQNQTKFFYCCCIILCTTK
jgi:hypothetical protein